MMRRQREPAAETLRLGQDRLRLRPWAGDAGTGLLILLTPGAAVSDSIASAAIEAAAGRGYNRLRTSALSGIESEPFIRAGFEPCQVLALLSRPSQADYPDRTAAPPFVELAAAITLRCWPWTTPPSSPFGISTEPDCATPSGLPHSGTFELPTMRPVLLLPDMPSRDAAARPATSSAWRSHPSNRARGRRRPRDRRAEMDGSLGSEPCLGQHSLSTTQGRCDYMSGWASKRYLLACKFWSWNLDGESRARPAGRRRPGSVALGLATALMVLASPAFWLANAAAQEDDAPSDEFTPAFELVSQSMWIGDEDVFRVSLRLLDAPDESTVDIDIGLPIRSRSAFLDRLAEPSTGLGLHQISQLAIPEPDANGITTLEVATSSSDVPAAEALGLPRLILSAEGVYPVSLVLRDSDGSRLDTIHTFLVRTPPPDPNQPPLLVSTVLSVSGPPAVSPEGIVDLGPTVRSLRSLADVFDPRIRPQPLAAVSVDPIWLMLWPSASSPSTPCCWLDSSRPPSTAR